MGLGFSLGMRVLGLGFWVQCLVLVFMELRISVLGLEFRF